MTATAPHLADPQLTDVTADHADSFLEAVASGFQEQNFDEFNDVVRPMIVPGRFFGYTVDEQWVSTFGAGRRTMTVPGGTTIDAAAVTVVTVQPPFRRRGLLTAMMQRGLESYAAAGEPVAILWASEAGIYGRFGFGAATSRLVLSGARSRMRFLPSAPRAGSVGEVGRDDYLSAAARIWDVVRAQRPGELNRGRIWWDFRVYDAEHARRGAGAMRFVLHYDDAGTPDGFAAYRFKEDSDGFDPAGEVRIADIHASTPAAYSMLWQYLLDLDLSGRFRYANAPVDAPLRHLLADARALGTELTDNIYLRVIDVESALTARQYAAPIDTVIEVSDEQLPANSGRYRVRAEAFATPVVERADDAEPDLSLSILELGAVYLGGVALRDLAFAGRVTEHTPGALDAATTAFSWPVAPHCSDDF
ncbi:GNAT family N-acetyltransferase [Epidermidibacterium keratini]|uniref:GNAT family N-acetyltransferase n=1 Tax=Epidermidibacterium keratini TaxID=1891644 RepID=A0A7L4YQU8_9ACTN|nr:GNAT family N-acetyltransferase [Epidermidibacterium keratini]QHC01611.1 GNAT family N-acetyltransferase [Epidermidibacterium keratini]